MLNRVCSIMANTLKDSFIWVTFYFDMFLIFVEIHVIQEAWASQLNNESLGEAERKLKGSFTYKENRFWVRKILGLTWWVGGKESTCQYRRHGFDPWVRKMEMWVWSLGQEGPLEKEMVTHSSVLAWETPWTEETGRLQSMKSQELHMTYQLNHHHQERYKF